MTKLQLEISHLAILRSCVEGDKEWKYFGSTAGVSHWLSEAEELGLVNSDRKPTTLGRRLAKHLELLSAPAGRAYMWSTADVLVKRGRLYIGDTRNFYKDSR
jgi:hypothetical protein